MEGEESNLNKAKITSNYLKLYVCNLNYVFKICKLTKVRADKGNAQDVPD